MGLTECPSPNMSDIYQDNYDMFEMDGDGKGKKSKKEKKKERLEGMKKEMDIVSRGRKNRDWPTDLRAINIMVEGEETNFPLNARDCLYLDWSHNNGYLCRPLQDDHEITIEELEMRYDTSIKKVTLIWYWLVLFTSYILDLHNFNYLCCNNKFDSSLISSVFSLYIHRD